jgi:glutathione S-transferase
MLELYHFAGAICAQKVRIALAEKSIPWKSRITVEELRSPAYLKLNPNGYVPTLLHDGNVVTESRIINEYIDAAFPLPSLLPQSPIDRARVGLWTKQIDDSLHLNVYVLTFTAVFRERYRIMSPQELDSALPLTNPIKRQYTLELLEHGFESPLFALAVARFCQLLADMETALSHSAWLVGDSYSLADVDFTPYLHRLDDLGLWPLLRETHPNVRRWISAVQARPSYKAAILGWETAKDEERNRIVSAKATPHFASALNVI